MNVLPKGYFFVEGMTDENLAAIALVNNLFILGWQLMPALARAMEGDVKRIVLIANGYNQDDSPACVAIGLLENNSLIHTFVKQEHRNKGLGSAVVKKICNEFDGVHAVEGIAGSIGFYSKNNLVAKPLSFH